MAKSSHLGELAVSELRKRHPHLRDPKYLEFFALKNQSLAAADLLAMAASGDRCFTAEDYIENFASATSSFEAGVSFARVYGLLKGDQARVKSLEIFEFALTPFSSILGWPRTKLPNIC